MNTNILSQSSNTEQLVEVITRQFNGEQVSEGITSSILVAKHFIKRYLDVMRAVKKCECSKEFSERNFALAEYTDEQGKPRSMYEMTKNGFSFIAMGFTGTQAAQFKESDINAFDEMSTYINSQNLTLIAQFNKAYLEFERADR